MQHFSFLIKRPSTVTRTPVQKRILYAEPLEHRVLLAVDVLGYKNNVQSTGLNAAEVSLSPANVRVNSFGKIFTTPVDGQVYAQPLVVNGVNITTGLYAGIRNVVYVATQNNSLYAIDADDAGLSGKILWQRSFLDLSNPNNNTLGASSITAVPQGDLFTPDIAPIVGITGTPVIDKASNTLYVVAKTKETIGGAAHYVQRLHAINLSDGSNRVAPYLIGDTTGGNINSTQIYVYGTGDGSVVDPYNGTGRRVVQFNALRQNQRPALSLVNNQVYVSWASHGDNGPYHGWVVSWDVSNLTTQGMKLSGALNTSPNNGLNGIWMAGGQLSFEPDGSAFYFETGNGVDGAPTLDANGFPSTANYNNALVKALRDSASTPTSQNANGWGMKIVDYFIPYNTVELDNVDNDFGSGGPLLLPDSMGIPGRPRLMIAGGKEGKLYVLDRDNLGKFNATRDNVVSTNARVGGLASTPSLFNNTVYIVSAYADKATSFRVGTDGSLQTLSQSSLATHGYLPGSQSISANGSSNGIVWTMDRNANVIRAYDAATFATEFWNSSQKGGGADNLGSVVKFAVPTVANGQVYVGTANSLVGYGLTPPATAVPNAPGSFTATSLSGSSIQLSWIDLTPSPNTASGYEVEQSTDGVNFTQVTTAAAGASGISIGGLSLSTRYYFRVRGYNGLGRSPYSVVASAVTSNQLTIIDFSSGFAGSTSTLSYNGGANLNGTAARLTTKDAGVQATSIFSKVPVDITKFQTAFTFRLSPGVTADGFTFTVQSNSPTAVGSLGGGLGYGTDNGVGERIFKSVAVKFDLYSNLGEGNNSTGLYRNGSDPMNVGSVDLTPSRIDLHSGRVFFVRLTYDGAKLSMWLEDTQVPALFLWDFFADIPADVRGTTAYVGFTAGTGGATATQEILSWTYTPSTALAPAAPSGLGGAPASGSSVALNWTNNATNQTGFLLDRATDAAFTLNLNTQNLPASPNSFTDNLTGLAPGGTFYYRVRAINAAGVSANSNVARIDIPVAPPKPDNARVVGVGTHSVDLEWIDNAGRLAEGYRILRSDNRGVFNVIALLPASNLTPPQAYTWTDATVLPGVYYSYHVIAYNVSGHNDFSGTNTTTLTLPPTSLAAVSGDARVSLSWTPPVGAQAYHVYRSTSPIGQGAIRVASNVTTASFVDTGLTNGVTYYYTVTALNDNLAPLPSESAPSAQVSATPRFLFSRSINFSSSATEIPAGFTNDLGEAYGPRPDGLVYGWNIRNIWNARNRNNPLSPNEQYDSLNHMQKQNNPNAWWGIAVPNGNYRVTIVAGDPDNFDSVYRINVGGTLANGLIVGGTLAVTGTPSTTNRWIVGTATVSVTQGILYVSNGAGGVNNKINSIVITQVVAPPPAPPSPPTRAANLSVAAIGSASERTDSPIKMLRLRRAAR